MTGAVPSEDDNAGRLGLALGRVPERLRDHLGLDQNYGVIVQGIEPNTPAAKNGLKEGDVIVSANGQAVSRPSDVAGAWATARGGKKPLLLRVNRDGEFLFIAVTA